MKRILAAIAFTLSSSCFAGGVIVATAPTKAGGIAYLVARTPACNSSEGVMLFVPFRGYVHGCVTSIDKPSHTVHAVFEEGSENDYDIADFTFIKGAM